MQLVHVLQFTSGSGWHGCTVRQKLNVSARRLQVLYALSALNLPDLLHNSPKTASELAPMAGEPVYGANTLSHGSCAMI